MHTTSEFGELRLTHRFDEVSPLPVTPGAMAAVFNALQHESNAVIQLATMSSQDPYWLGWASCSTAQPFQSSQVILPDTEHLVSSCTFASPLSIDSILKLPKGLVEAGFEAFRSVFERLYFPEEERQRRRIANAIAAEELTAARIANLERELKLAEQFREHPVSRLLIERLAHNWTWPVGPGTQPILPFKLADASVSLAISGRALPQPKETATNMTVRRRVAQPRQGRRTRSKTK